MNGVIGGGDLTDGVIASASIRLRPPKPE